MSEADSTAAARWQAPEADQAVPRLPALPARHRALGQEDSRASCTTSARGTTPTPRSRSTWNRRTPCTPAASRARHPTGVTVKDLCNEFLNAKQALVDSGELTNRSWQDYKAACDLIVSHFGKARLVADLDPDDFAALRSKMAKKWGPVTLGQRHPAHSRRLQVRLRQRPDRPPGALRPERSSGRPERRCASTGRRRGRSCSPPTKSAACSTPPARRCRR